jgi:hypothetical protein
MDMLHEKPPSNDKKRPHGERPAVMQGAVCHNAQQLQSREKKMVRWELAACPSRRLGYALQRTKAFCLNARQLTRPALSVEENAVRFKYKRARMRRETDDATKLLEVPGRWN